MPPGALFGSESDKRCHSGSFLGLPRGDKVVILAILAIPALSAPSVTPEQAGLNPAKVTKG